MALTILTGSSQAAAFNYSYTTSGSADWASVPTASYFYDIVDKTIRFKSTNSTFSNVATASFALTASNVVGTVTSASYALTASYAMNGGVTQLLAGPNVTLSPTNGLGQVTISSTSGGGGFNTATGSYGSFYDTTTQTNPVANIPRSMSLNTTDITNGVSISGSTNPFNTYIKTQNAGVYNIQFSAQLDKTDSGADEIVIWLRKNGIDLNDTATSVTLTGNNAKNVAAWNWFVNSAANDYYQIIWQSADTDVRLFAEPTDGHPGIPSVIVTANRVDQFLSNTGSFSGSFTGVFTGSLQGTATTASFVTASNVVGTVTSASYALSASYAPGGGGTPGGSNQAVQFNNSGTLGGEDFFRYDSAYRSVSNGLNVTASGSYSHAEGYSTQASGSYSHAEGNDTLAVGDYSHAEGEETKAIGIGSHTEGLQTQAGSYQGYLATTVTSGTCSLDVSYGDVSAEYNPGDLILLDDFSYGQNYISTIFTVDTTSWDGNNTQITLTDLSVNTPTAIIGNITYGVQNWVGGYPIGGYYSHAEGGSTYAIGAGSHAEGDSTEAYSRVSHAEGAETKAIGEYSHAEGYQTQAIGSGSHAEGSSTIASGSYSHAEGDNTQAIGDGSHAEGYQTQAIGAVSHAEGDLTQAIGNGSHAEGIATFAGSNQGYLATTVIDGVCTLDASYSDVSSEYNPGDNILFDDTAYDGAYGLTTFIVASSSYSGSNTLITLTDISVTCSQAIIGNITYGIKNWSGGYSIGGSYSHAEGDSTQAIGDGSHAEGGSTQAIGNFSHAEGDSTLAIGKYSHAEGSSTIASGSYSHAEGDNTQAIGDGSHAEGDSTIASGSYQHVSGKYNTHGDTTSLFIVGNGVDDSTRSDAFKVTPSGSIVLPIIQSSTPSWTGIPGEMIFYDDGAGNYRMFVWLDGGWRSVSVA